MVRTKLRMSSGSGNSVLIVDPRESSERSGERGQTTVADASHGGMAPRLPQKKHAHTPTIEPRCSSLLHTFLHPQLRRRHLLLLQPALRLGILGLLLGFFLAPAHRCQHQRPELPPLRQEAPVCAALDRHPYHGPDLDHLADRRRLAAQRLVVRKVPRFAMCCGWKTARCRIGLGSRICAVGVWPAGRDASVRPLAWRRLRDGIHGEDVWCGSNSYGQMGAQSRRVRGCRGLDVVEEIECWSIRTMLATSTSRQYPCHVHGAFGGASQSSSQPAANGVR
jgi:hypothetical protein